MNKIGKLGNLKDKKWTVYKYDFKTGFIKKLERLLAENEIVNKVTVNIFNEDNKPQIINTDEFAKQFNLIVSKNQNGEVISEDIFMQMKDLIWKKWFF